MLATRTWNTRGLGLPSTSKDQYLHGPQLLRLEARPLTPIGPSEVRIRVRSTTLCGSDVHYFKFHKKGSIEVKKPLCGGHEAAGGVVEVDPTAFKTQGIRVGDSAAIESGVACLEWTLQEYVGHPSEWCHRLPDILSYDDGALLEPLSVCIHSVNRAGMNQGARCLIFGAGAVGLLCAAVAKIEHEFLVAITDMDEGRVAFALEHGFADVGYVVVPKKGDTVDSRLFIAKDLAREVGKLKWPGDVGQVDHFFECTGVESCAQTSIYATKNGGNVVLVGMGTAIQTWPVAELTGREINVVSVWRYVNCYPRAIEIMNDVKLDALKPDVTILITHRFSGLDSIPHAYDTASKTRDAESKLVIKAVVNL
ncbi:alcohol dehydrogenase [Aspergillus recurvatus]